MSRWSDDPARKARDVAAGPLSESRDAAPPSTEAMKPEVQAIAAPSVSRTTCPRLAHGRRRRGEGEHR